MDGARPRGGARARQSSRAAEARGQGRPRTTNMQGEARTPAAAASAAAGAASSIPRSSGVSRLGVAVPAPGAAAACAASSPITLPPWRGAPTWLGMRTRSKLVCMPRCMSLGSCKGVWHRCQALDGSTTRLLSRTGGSAGSRMRAGAPGAHRRVTRAPGPADARPAPGSGRRRRPARPPPRRARPPTRRPARRRARSGLSGLPRGGRPLSAARWLHCETSGVPAQRQLGCCGAATQPPWQRRWCDGLQRVRPAGCCPAGVARVHSACTRSHAWKSRTRAGQEGVVAGGGAGRARAAPAQAHDAVADELVDLQLLRLARLVRHAAHVVVDLRRPARGRVGSPASCQAGCHREHGDNGEGACLRTSLGSWLPAECASCCMRRHDSNGKGDGRVRAACAPVPDSRPGARPGTGRLIEHGAGDVLPLRRGSRQAP